MVLETCPQLVAENRSFYPNPDSEETHPYRTCEEIYPKWHIKEDASQEISLYWKYVVAKFKKELAKLYGMNEDTIPPHWNKIELSEALYDL